MIKEIVKLLTEKEETLATMESCTGGALASAITDVSGASAILKRSYITYSTEAKIDLGVEKETIDQYTVYSEEVAKEMARNASLLAKSTYGVGITGQIDRLDPNNEGGNLNKVNVSIYNALEDNYINTIIFLNSISREECKSQIVKQVATMLLELLLRKDLLIDIPSDI